MLAVKGLPDGWFLNYSDESPEVELRIFETFRQVYHKPMVILRLLLIKHDLTWEVYVGDHTVPPWCAILSNFPPLLNGETLLNLIGAVSSVSICRGNCEERIRRKMQLVMT